MLRWHHTHFLDVRDNDVVHILDHGVIVGPVVVSLDHVDIHGLQLIRPRSLGHCSSLLRLALEDDLAETEDARRCDEWHHGDLRCR